MKLVINIEQSIAEAIALHKYIPKDYEDIVVNAICNATPLPEGKDTINKASDEEDEAYLLGDAGYLQGRKRGVCMKIKFTKDFANNWKVGDIAEAKYISQSEILVDGVAKVDSQLLLKHCVILSESENK